MEPFDPNRLEFVKRGKNTLIPVTSVMFRKVPTGKCINELKLLLQQLYGGPVHSLSRGRRKSLLVRFESAETATAALRQRKNWPDGRPIVTVPANRQTESAAAFLLYSDLSRLFGSLNEDCLHHLCKYLPFWDIINLAKSSPQMAVFADANVFAKLARNCTLFTLCANTDLSRAEPISFSAFSDAIRVLGPHLTHLSVSGKRLEEHSVSGEQCVLEILKHCPRLTSLRLDFLSVDNIDPNQPLDGRGHPQLQELCMTCVTDIDEAWLTFIGQLSGLQTLMIHHSLSKISWHHPTMESLACNQLRVLSVQNMLCPWVLSAIAANRDTLRVVNVGCTDNSLSAEYYQIMAWRLAHLESMTVGPLENRAVVLDGTRNLRKIIVHEFDPSTVQWLTQLAAAPNCVEHIVLVSIMVGANYGQHTAREVCDVVHGFGAQLRVLEMNRLTVPISSTMDLEPIFKRLSRLQTLRIAFSDLDLTPMLMAAIRACRELSRVVVMQSRSDLEVNVPLLVRTLRETSAGGSNRRLWLQLDGCLGLYGLESMAKDDALLQANADVLQLSVNSHQTSRHGIGLAPVEEYMLVPSLMFECGQFNFERQQWDDHEPDEYDGYDDFHEFYDGYVGYDSDNDDYDDYHGYDEPDLDDSDIF